ncbi:MAG: 4Fe-4S binding protein [Planctomycetota bacterium]
MPHYIMEDCVGCTLCAKNCPTQAISGETKSLFIIDPHLCIDCHICGNVCPVSCILDEFGNVVPKQKVPDKPKAIIIEDGCTGCDACLEACPVDAIVRTDPSEPNGVFQVCTVIPDKCIGCELCAKVCPWDTIVMEENKLLQPVATAES